jgi:hypothetical protein
VTVVVIVAAAVFLLPSMSVKANSELKLKQKVNAYQRGGKSSAMRCLRHENARKVEPLFAGFAVGANFLFGQIKGLPAFSVGC